MNEYGKIGWIETVYNIRRNHYYVELMKTRKAHLQLHREFSQKYFFLHLFSFTVNFIYNYSAFFRDTSHNLTEVSILKHNFQHFYCDEVFKIFSSDYYEKGHSINKIHLLQFCIVSYNISHYSLFCHLSRNED